MARWYEKGKQGSGDWREIGTDRQPDQYELYSLKNMVGLSEARRALGGNQSSKVGDRLQSQHDAANAANEARFQKLIELSQRFGQSMLADNATLTQQQMAGAGSNLMSRGLGNSTIVNSVQGGIQRQGLNQAARIQDMMLQNQQGIIERRTDQHPNLGLYAQLAMQPGAM